MIHSASLFVAIALDGVNNAVTDHIATDRNVAPAIRARDRRDGDTQRLSTRRQFCPQAARWRSKVDMRMARNIVDLDESEGRWYSMTPARGGFLVASFVSRLSALTGDSHCRRSVLAFGQRVRVLM